MILEERNRRGNRRVSLASVDSRISSEIQGLFDWRIRWRFVRFLGSLTCSAERGYSGELITRYGSYHDRCDR